MNIYQERKFERELGKMNDTQLRQKLAKVRSQLATNLLAHNRKGIKTKRQENQAIQARLDRRN